MLYPSKLLEQLGFVQKPPTPVYEDKTACIEWGNIAIGGRERAKHIDIRKRFAAHEVVQNGETRLVRVPTSSQLADILGKGPHFPQRQACVEGILSKKVNSEECDAVVRQAEARAGHRLESCLSESRDSDDVGGESGGGRLRADAEVPLEISGSQPLRFIRADP